MEAYLPGARDLEVSVIGNDPARLELYGPGEILPDTSSTTTRRSTRPVSPRPRSAPRSRPSGRDPKLARDTYRAIGAEGFARIDFLVVDEQLLSEINTIPGFTPISLFPTLPADGGYTSPLSARRVVASPSSVTPAASIGPDPADLPR